MQSKITYVVFILFSFSAFNALAIQVNPHDVGSRNNNECVDCHLVQPRTEKNLNSKNSSLDLSKYHLDGVAMCTSCHIEEGHIVGVTLDFSVPADLPLAADKSISCLTCHYVHGSLYSDRPQASYSFMDSLLGSDRLHKSFLIRRNNVNGELCLICHNIQQRTTK